MPDDYISRKAAKNAITDQWWEEIDRVPAEDVRPVVHCKNCNLWFEDDKVGYENLGNVSAPCLYFSDLENSYTVCTKPDDFCSYGEEVEE